MKYLLVALLGLYTVSIAKPAFACDCDKEKAAKCEKGKKCKDKCKGEKCASAEVTDEGKKDAPKEEKK